MKAIKSLLVLFISLIGCSTGEAIPAKIGITTFVQPDGTTIKIKFTGNGDLHFVTTEDGKILAMDSLGFYRLADINEDGLLTPSVHCPNESTRSQNGITIKQLDLRKFAARNTLSSRSFDHAGKGRLHYDYPSTGTPHVPIILVEYSDVKFSDAYDVKNYFNEMANGDNFKQFGSYGSLKQYFNDQSYGKFIPTFDVLGPVTLDKPREYYGDNYGQGWDVKAHQMVSDAVTILDPEVDFSIYDEDGDGDVDFIYIIYAGHGEHRGGGEKTVWPHAGQLKEMANFKMADGKFLNAYACSNELIYDTPEGMGAFVHEYCHILGLPDLYTTDMIIEERDFTPGPYTILDYGVYNNDGRTPPNFTAYERNVLEWNDPVYIDMPMKMEMNEISTGEFGLIAASENEFFLIENRQQTGWDEYLPNHGMLIWHIDYNPQVFENNEVNLNPDHQYVDLLEANNRPGYSKYAADFTFPGTTGNDSFSPYTSPALKTWNGDKINLSLNNIREEDGIIYFDVETGDTGGIVMEKTDDEKIEVYNIYGQKVYEGTKKGLISLSKGIYIVNGNKIIL